MPAHAKPNPQRDRGRQGAVVELAVVDGEALDVPKPPPKLLKPIREAWDQFWASDLAQVVTDPDRPVVFRMFSLRNDQERALRRYRSNPYITGSQGQPVQNPAFQEAMALERQVLALEDRLGLSPKARAQLGIAIGEARMTAAELNRVAQEDAPDDGDRNDSGVLDVDGWEEAN